MRSNATYPSRLPLQRFLRGVFFATAVACGVFVALWYNRQDLLAIGSLLSFVPFIFLRTRRSGAPIDFFSPDVGFPLIYIAYLFISTIDLPVVSQFNLTLPWTQWIYYSIGLAAYLLGTATVRQAVATSVPLSQPRFWDRSRFGIAVTLFLAMGLVGRTIKVALYGIPLLHPEEEELRIKYPGGYAGNLAFALEILPVCLVLYLSVCKPSKRVQWAVILLILFLILDAVSGDSRGGVMRIFIASLVTIHYARSRIRIKSLLLCGLIAVLVASAIGTYRDMSVFGDVNIQGLESKGYTPYTLWLGSTYESLRVTTEGFDMLLRHMDRQSYTYGATSLAALAIPLPGHRPGPGEIVKKELGFDFIGFGASTTILGPLYMDGGCVAIVIGMMLWGMLAKWLYIRMLGATNFFWVLTYAYFVQNQFKAIKDEMFPELGPIFAVLYFALIHYISSGTFRVHWNSFLNGYAARHSEA
jgi:oligosaccharide repeat unit polymerase